LKHTVPIIIDALVLQTFFHSTWVQGVAYQKQLLGPKSMWVCARGAFQKCGTLFIYATIKARNSKFGIQLEFAE